MKSRINGRLARATYATAAAVVAVGLIGGTSSADAQTLAGLQTAARTTHHHGNGWTTPPATFTDPTLSTSGSTDVTSAAAADTATQTADTTSAAADTTSTASTAAAATTDASTTGGAMPVGNLPGWNQTLAQDFTTNVSAGSFPGPYASSFMSYNGFTDTSGIGVYDQNIISANDGVLNLALHTNSLGVPLGAAPIPLVNGQWGGQTYGRFSVRMRSDALSGYGAAFLLWSDANNWNDGEIDFPEGNLDGTAWAHNHVIGNPTDDNLDADTGVDFTGWHTYTIDWTPTLLSYEVDGTVVAQTTSNIPSKPLHWVMQVGTNGSRPASSTAGNVQIDWATVYSYNP